MGEEAKTKTYMCSSCNCTKFFGYVPVLVEIDSSGKIIGKVTSEGIHLPPSKLEYYFPIYCDNCHEHVYEYECR